jgi:Generalcontrol nonderepressible 1 (Gcn1) N-terminal
VSHPLHDTYPQTAIIKFYSTYKQSVLTEEYYRILTPVLSCAKSTSATVRSGAIHLFRAISQGASGVPDSKRALELILAPSLGGKSNGADHRQALYSMLESVPTTPTTSRDLVQKMLSLMEKETSEMVLTTHSEVVPKHLAYLLQGEGEPTVGPSIAAIIVKDLSSAKSTSRRAMAMAVGQTFWYISQSDAAWSPTADRLFQDLQQALEKILSEAQTISSSVVTGPTEAWVALTVLLCACQKSVYGKRYLLQNSIAYL